MWKRMEEYDVVRRRSRKGGDGKMKRRDMKG